MMLTSLSRIEGLLFPGCSFHRLYISRWRLGVTKLSKENSSEPNIKRAKLYVKKKERIKLPYYNDGGGGSTVHPISEFFSHPSGIEAILNTRALRGVEPIDSNTYRCTLPQLNLLNFEVSPVLDLRVSPTKDDCTVELLSCKFQGSEVVEQQNDRFSALMTNYIKWGTKNSEQFLDVDVKLNLLLEIYTQPFTMLPTSAVEVPGTLVMQALVDRLVPLLLEQLLRDYETWMKSKSQRLP